MAWPRVVLASALFPAGGNDTVRLVVRPHMRRLSDELGVQVVASTVMGDDIIVLAVEGHAAMPNRLVSRQVAPYGRRLTEVTTTISKEIGGRSPDEAAS